MPLSVLNVRAPLGGPQQRKEVQTVRISWMNVLVKAPQA